MKLLKILSEQTTTKELLQTLKQHSEKFEDKLNSYSDQELRTILDRLEDLLPSSATTPDTLIQNIADFIDGVLDVADEIDYKVFDYLESLPPMKLFDFYADFEMIIHGLIEHIEGNIVYSRSQERSGVD